ncbi:MAG: zinc-binding dehydrogenase [Streptosporangiales bacterium]|nr:zinc-binding dehydrogenase [Streptosporangiales bacterium]
MATSTKAAVFRGVDQPLDVTELDLGAPREHEVLVRYAASGLCHSDLHIMDGSMAHPAPAVLGHEGAGVVAAVGPGVSRVAVGDHVLTSYQPSCGHCWYCTAGRSNLCELRDKPRTVMADGTARFAENGSEVLHLFQISSHAERTVVPEECLVPIRRDAPLEVVCLVSCGVATGAGAVINRAKVHAGATVVVIGCGGVGLNAVQAARLVGAAKVVAVDRLPHKLETACEFGATHTVDGTDSERCLAQLKEICGRDGADYAIEAVGTQATVELAFHCLHRGGTAVVAGVTPDGTRISLDPRLLLQERVLTGTSFGSVRQRLDLPMIVDLFMDGRFRLRELVSREVGLDEVNDAYGRLAAGEIRREVLVHG